MLQNFLFRGWFTGAGDIGAQWVQGSLLHEMDESLTIMAGNEGFAVERDSVGQATVAVLSDGNLVFSGDLLQQQISGQGEEFTATGEVYYCDVSFKFKVRDDYGDNEDLEDWLDAKVVGTSFENTELMKRIVSAQ